MEKILGQETSAPLPPPPSPLNETGPVYIRLCKIFHNTCKKVFESIKYHDGSGCFGLLSSDQIKWNKRQKK